MGQFYALPWTATVTNAGGNTDLWEISPADDKPVRIWKVELGQTSEVGDAAEEGLVISVLRLTATVTSGNGTAGTAEDLSRSNQTPGFSWEFNGSTVATTTGTTETVGKLAWNIRQTPFERWYPDERFTVQAVQGEALIIRMDTTVADDITFAGELIVEEL